MRKPSTRRTLTTLAMLALSAATPVLVTTAAGPAAAATTAATQTRTAGACTSPTKGVTVVADFSKLGGKVQTACDPTNPKTGLAALTGAGFTYTFVPRFPGFVCTIDKMPHPCNGAPTGAYWSYWHATPHGKWIFSNKGAGTYHPAPGSVQGWAFGAGKPPSISPP